MANRDNLARSTDPASEPSAEVANDPVYTGEPYAADVRPEIQRKTVGGNFARNESVTARAYKNAANENAANDDSVDENNPLPPRRLRESIERAEELAEQAERVAAISERLRGRAPGARVSGSTGRAVAGLKSARAVFGWSVLWAVGIAYLWQLLFAVISLVGFSVHAFILDTQTNTWWGNIVSFFVDFSKIVPADYLGYAFFGINFLLVLGVFIILVLWYQIVHGVSVLTNTMSTLITATCLALSILPITNLFPWLLVWAIYMELLKTKVALTSLFSAAS